MHRHWSSMAANRIVLSLCVLLVLHGVAWRGDAASYTVGNSAGWDLSTDFPAWVDGKTFHVGDVLVFTYSKYHTLEEVDEAGFRNCSVANALLSGSDGNTTVALAAPGDRYFICGNDMHCLGGMKLHVLVNQPPSSPAGGPAAAGQPAASPGSALGPSTDDAGIPTLSFGGSHRLGVGPMLFVAWLCIAAALLV